MTRLDQDPKVLSPLIGLPLVGAIALAAFCIPDITSGPVLEAVVPDASESLHNWVYRLTMTATVIGGGLMIKRVVNKMDPLEGGPF